MRTVRLWWLRLRGWWLLTVAAAAAAVLSALATAYTGFAAAALVSIGGAIAGVISERGRTRLAMVDASRNGPFRRRIAQIDDPLRLGVHPAERQDAGAVGDNRVPPFVTRDRLPELEDALGAGGLVLVVGDSTAGKTRLAYEALRRRLPEWFLIDPGGADGLLAAVDAAIRSRPSVLWLDDLERYLGPHGLTGATLERLSVEGNGRVLVLATMRAHEREMFSQRFDVSREDRDRQAIRSGREVLDGATTEVTLDRRWSDAELTRAEELRGDPRIAAAVQNSAVHGVAEYLAAAPQLLRELRDAWAAAPRGRRSGGPRGAALVTAAVDARRAGYHRPLPLSLLRELHENYLRALGGAAFRAGSWDDAFGWATEALHATTSLLEPVGDDTYLAFDYLVDAAARDPESSPVPDATWRALVEFAEPADAVGIIWEASYSGNTEFAPRVFERALAAGLYIAAAEVATCLGEAGHETHAAALLERVLREAAPSASCTPADLMAMRRAAIWYLGETVAGYGDPARAAVQARALVADAERTAGPTDPLTLRAKILLARQVGGAGDPAEALSIAEGARDDAMARADTADHDIVHLARFEVAVWARGLHGADLCLSWSLVVAGA